MLKTKGSKLAAAGAVAAAATAGAMYLMRKRAHDAEPLDSKGDQEVSDIADAVVIEIEVDEPLIVSGESIETADDDTNDDGESWVEALEAETAETGPLPGREVPYADSSEMEPAHHSSKH